jgi:preprotein translocase subunit SecA
MIQWALRKIIGTRNQRELKRIWPLVKKINAIEESLRSLPDEALAQKTLAWKAELSQIQDFDQLQERLEEILPEAFAVVKNAARRLCGRTITVCDQPLTWEMVHFDVQLIGGIALHRGRIAEMATGEGKTLVATLPVYLNALTGRGVHLVTVNDYLARRDSEWMGALYTFLGLTVGCIQNDQPPHVRRQIYTADITYGTNSEFGFDYLRDNGMAGSKADQVQRGHYFAIVDEVDSVLIDEARTPLIISGPVTHDSHQYDVWKPHIERLVKAQTTLLNETAAEAWRLHEQKQSEEAGRLFYKVKLGQPRHKQVMRAMEEPELRRAIEKAELSFYQDTQKKELFEFKETLYFSVDEKAHEADLTEKGRSFLDPKDPDAFVLPDLATGLSEIEGDVSLSRDEKNARREALQSSMDQQAQRMHNIAQLLKAYCLYERDVHYMVGVIQREGEEPTGEPKVIILDENTGRAMPGRRWSDGLHQAVEAKEGVRIDRETQTLATITIQNYFRLYAKLAGMTGTAETDASEFHDIYRLDLLVIPQNRPVKRVDHNDKIYKTQREKYNAVIGYVKERHEKGQPILLGTASVEASEVVSRMLKREKIPHTVLNAKFHQQEAQIVAAAGQKGAVTVSTNMAGRGTDIKLGPGVAELGGLLVIGTERHESRRTDRQLRGRCARQGDPGESIFFISFEDKLMLNFGAAERMTKMMERFGLEDGQELEHPWLNRSIESAQKKVETRNYTWRKRVLDYDDVMNQQREVVYGYRNEVLESDNPRALVMEALEQAVPAKVDELTAPSETGVVNYDGLLNWVNITFPIRLTKEDAQFESRDAAGNAEFIVERVRALYEEKMKGEHEEGAKELERYIVLNAIDRQWQDHLYTMDGLREGAHWMAIGQKDPLIEYKKEAFALFEGLMVQIKQEALNNMFRSTTNLQAFEQFLMKIMGGAPAPEAPAARRPASAPASPALGTGSASGASYGSTMTGASTGGGVSFLSMGDAPSPEAPATGSAEGATEPPKKPLSLVEQALLASKNKKK